MSVLFSQKDINYCSFDTKNQDEFEKITKLISENLSEPYSIYVYWYFLNQWSQYCYVVKLNNSQELIGVIISKVERFMVSKNRGYIGMIVIDHRHRNKSIASNLVKITINNMILWDKIVEVVLETEVTNIAALKLYKNFGFIKTKRLYKYYYNAHDAFRLVLPLTNEIMKDINLK